MRDISQGRTVTWTARRESSATRLLACLILAVVIVAGGPAGAQNAHDFAFETPAGERLPLKRWAGVPVLVAVGDPFCGLTNQYPGLEALWQRYRDNGLTVLGVPLEDFVQRQSIDSAEFAAYCRDMVGITFPLASSVSATGDDAHPVFDWIRGQAGPDAVPRLAFYKYLIGPDGDLIAWFPPSTDPEDAAIRNAIEQALGIGEAAG